MSHRTVTASLPYLVKYKFSKIATIRINTCDRCTGRYCWERVLAMAILSVRPSGCSGVTTRYRIKPRSDRDSGFSPYGSLEVLVSNDVIWCRFHAVIHILTVNYAEIIQDRPGQLAYEMFGIKRRLQRCKVWPPRFKESSVRVHQIWVHPWKRAISTSVD